jgi:pseudaminic acid cytidylyltransferase
VICIIPARSGSTRIPGKNTKEFHGKPIIEYSITTALNSGLFEKIILSIDEIYEEAHKIGHRMGIEVHMRPDELANNSIGTQHVMRDAIKEFSTYSTKDNIFCCLYATSPLLSTKDLSRGAFLLKRNPTMQYSFSVGTNPLHDAGQFYWGYKEAFLSDLPVHAEHSIMVPISDDRVQDINTQEDWDKALEKYEQLHR